MTSCLNHWTCHSSDILGDQCHTLSKKIPRYFSHFTLSCNNLDSVVTDSVLYLFHPLREVTFLLRGANFPNDQMTSLPFTQWNLFFFLLCRHNKQCIIITIAYTVHISLSSAVIFLNVGSNLLILLLTLLFTLLLCFLWRKVILQEVVSFCLVAHVGKRLRWAMCTSSPFSPSCACCDFFSRSPLVFFGSSSNSLIRPFSLL